MHTSISVIAICLCLAAAAGCAKKKAEQSPPAPDTTAVPQKIEFVAPADSTVTVDQMSNWLKCNRPLDSLSIAFQDLLKNADSVERTARQDEFMQSQDQICVATGLRGGYDEYLWVSQNAGNPKNKPVLDSLDITLF
jgi:hypothetical protein